MALLTTIAQAGRKRKLINQPNDATKAQKRARKDVLTSGGCSSADSTPLNVTTDQEGNGREEVDDTNFEETARSPLVKQYSCQFKDCNQKFISRSGVSKHVNKIHNISIRSLPRAYSCPLKDKLKCNTTFSSRSAVCNHVKRIHKTSMPPRPKPYPCPLKDKLKCDAAFTNHQHVAKHVRNVHKIDYSKEFGPPRPKAAYECPRKEDLSCSKTYSTPSGANCHAKYAHSAKRFPCPRKEDLDCQMTFITPWNARKHAKEQHSGE